MVKSAFCVLAGTAALGIMLSPGVASAVTIRPAVLAYSNGPGRGAGSDPDTTVTFTVTSGALSLIWLVLGGLVLVLVVVMGRYALQQRRRHAPA
jgi:hypothetical protein